MITGRQIRDARKLLKLSTARLSSLAHLSVATVERAEGVDGMPAITLAQGKRLETALNALGAVFHWNGSVTLGSPPRPDEAGAEGDRDDRETP